MPGLVMKRYIMGGDPTITCVSIRKIDKVVERKKKEEKKS